MSVQTGIRYFDGREPSRQEVGFLLDGLESRGPDYINIFTSRHFGMGFRGFLVAPEEQQNQPLIGRNGSALTFDGRLDGRANVYARLPCHSTQLDDASLVLLAYELFGHGVEGLADREDQPIIKPNGTWRQVAVAAHPFINECGAETDWVVVV